MAKDLLKIKTIEEVEKWVKRFTEWMKKYQKFLGEMTVDEYGNKRPTHERLLKAQRSLLKLVRGNTIFTCLDEDLLATFSVPSTNNRIEGGVNSRLIEMLSIYQKMNERNRLEKSLSIWGDAIVWNDLHKVDKSFGDWD